MVRFFTGIGVAFAAAALSGCGTWQPRPPTYSNGAVEAVGGGAAPVKDLRLAPIASFSAADATLEKYEQAYAYYAFVRHDDAFRIGDGAVAAAGLAGLGLLAKNKLLLGSGVAVGALSATANTRYDPKAQLAVFLRGYEAIGCLRRLVAGIPGNGFTLATRTQGIEAVKSRVSASGTTPDVRDLNEAVDRINNEIIREMLTIGNAIPTMDQLRAAYDNLYQRRQATQEEAKAKSLSAQETAQVLAIATFKEEAAACAAKAATH